MIYVDKIFEIVQDDGQIKKRCHLWGDRVPELEKIAIALGLQEIKMVPGFWHYELTPMGRKRAIALGAVEIDAINWLANKKSMSAAFAY